MPIAIALSISNKRWVMYNKKGELITKFSAFPENVKVKAMINELLQAK
jgi:hypothetical protein